MAYWWCGVSDLAEVDMLDLLGGFVLMSDGQTVPITNFFDEDGDECDPLDAVSVVAGPHDGLWLSVEVGEERLVLH